MFLNAASFTGKGISKWRVGRVETFRSMFESAGAFVGDVGPWDVSGSSDFSWMFCEAALFDSDLSGWSVGHVSGSGLSDLFRDAKSFRGIGLEQWDVSRAENISRMFLRCTSFTADVSSWRVAQVSDMDSILLGATSFAHQLGGEWSTSTATMRRAFDGCPGSILGRTKRTDGSISPL